MSMKFARFFDSIADHYEEKIIPAFGPLAQNLVDWADATTTDHVLDVGAGTGIAARLIAPRVAHVIATDIAPNMTRIAAQHNISNLTAIQADTHLLPFANDGFDMVITSFGLNATSPRRVFREIFRVLKPNGRFVLQEWGGVHQFDRLILDTLEVFMVDDEDAPKKLVQLRDFLSEDRAWYSLMQTEMDYVDELGAIGFNRLLVAEHQPVTVRLTLNEFMAYKLAWPSRIAELSAMDDSARGDCLDKIRELLQPFVDDDGLLNYAPALFRVQASKPRLSGATG